MLGVCLWSLVAHQWKLQRLCSTRTLRCRHHVHDNDGMYGCPGQGGDQLPWCTEGVSVCVWCLCCVCVCVVLFVIFVFVIKCAALCYKEKNQLLMGNNKQGPFVFGEMAFHFYVRECSSSSFLSSLNAPYFFFVSDIMCATVWFQAFLSKNSGFSKDSTNLALSLTIKRHSLICKRKSKIKIK